MIRSSLRFLDCMFINLKESWVALSFIRLWNHSSYESALNVSGIKWPFFFSGKSWHKAVEGNVLWAREDKAWDMIQMCRSRWWMKWWINRKQAKSVQFSFAKPWWSAGSILMWGAQQWLSFQKTFLSSSDAQFLFIFLLQQTWALHSHWSFEGLVTSPQVDIIPCISPFWLVQGIALGWRKAWVRCCVSLSLPEWLFLSALALDLVFTARVGEYLSWKCALTWIHSVFTWGCDAGFIWDGEARTVYLPVSSSRNLA